MTVLLIYITDVTHRPEGLDYKQAYFTRTFGTFRLAFKFLEKNLTALPQEHRDDVARGASVGTAPVCYFR
jgi:hypothetical protein